MESDSSEAPQSKSGKYSLNGRHVYVTWSKSPISAKEEFYEKMLAILPAGVRIYGVREHDRDGTRHYHVVMNFPKKQHWRDAVSRLTIPGDPSAIRIVKPEPRQSLASFYEKVGASCAKDMDGDVFREPLDVELPPVSARRKRKQRVVVMDCEDEGKKRAEIREIDPRAFGKLYDAKEEDVQEGGDEWEEALREAQYLNLRG